MIESYVTLANYCITTSTREIFYWIHTPVDVKSSVDVGAYMHPSVDGRPLIMNEQTLQAFHGDQIKY